MRQTFLSLSRAIFAASMLWTIPASAQITWDADTIITNAQDGGGAWDMANNNWWDGTTNVSFSSGSNVTFGAGAGAGAAGTITVDAGGVTAGSLTFNAPGSGSYTFTGGSITGGALIKNGSNGLRLDNANTFSSITVNGGPNSANDGAIRLGNAAALGTADITFANTSTATGLFFLTGFGSSTTMSNNIAFSTTGGVTTNILSTGVAGNALTLPGTFNNTTFSGLLTGGSATSIVNSNNTVSAGVSRLRVTNASNTVTLQHWNLNRGGLEFTSDGALGNAANDLRLDVTGVIVGTGLLFGANNIALNSGRSVTVQTQTVIDTQAFSGSQINGGITFTGNMVKRGTGDLRLNGAGTGAGGVSVFQGTVTTGSATAIGTGGITLGQSTNLTANTVGFSTAPLTNNVTVTNNIVLAGLGQRDLVMNGIGNGSNTAEYSGVISGSAGTLFLNNSQAGSFNPQFILSNAGNTFTANVRVNRGGLRISSNTVLGNAANTVTFDSNAGADLTFLSAMTYTRNTTLSTATDFDTGANAVTASGTISGGSGLTKIGSGTLTLTGANTFSGGTIVNAGTLLVNNTTGSGTGTGNVTIASGATLGGDGFLTGAVTVNGLISPGIGIGSLDIGSLNLNDLSTIVCEMDTQSLFGDLLNVNGGLALNGTVNLSFSELVSGTVAPNSKLSLISYSGAWNGGIFSGFADDSIFTLGSNDWLIDYNDSVAGTNGGLYSSFVTLTSVTAVPEPSSFVFGMLVSGAGLFARFRRRQTRKAN